VRINTDLGQRSFLISYDGIGIIRDEQDAMTSLSK
jgi:hypothetical protein